MKASLSIENETDHLPIHEVRYVWDTNKADAQIAYVNSMSNNKLRSFKFSAFNLKNRRLFIGNFRHSSTTNPNDE